MWTGKKDRGRGTAIGVVQDQLSPLLWVALYLPQNPKTRSSTETAIKIAADGFRPNKKNATRKWRPYRGWRAAASRPAIQLGAILPILSGPLCFLRTSTIKTFKTRTQSKAVRYRARAVISAAAAGERAPMSSRHPEDARSMEPAATKSRFPV